MMFAAIDFVDWVSNQFALSPLIVEQALWYALLVGLIFATIHLTTMLVTRWGDHDPTAKSLIFSVIVHLSCLSGLVVVSPPVAQTKPTDPDDRVQIRRLFLEGEEKPELREVGNTPVWEKLAKTAETDLERLQRSPLEFVPLEIPYRKQKKLTAPDLDVPDLTQLPDEPIVRPEPKRNAIAGVKIEAVVPLKIDEKTQDARPEVNVPMASTVRRRLEQSGLDEAKVERKPNRGRVDRVQKELDPQRLFAAIEAKVDPASSLKRSTTGAINRRRSGPSPSTLPIEDTGTVAKKPNEGSASGSTGKPRFSRLKTRTMRSREDGSLNRFRDERKPQTPQSRPYRAVAVRDGISTKLPREGLRPNIVRPNFKSVRTRQNTKIPATYRLRRLEQRKEIARKYGGTDASERAVESSLRWLALHQHTDGYWDADGFGNHWPNSAGPVGRSGRVQIDEEGVDRKRAGIQADTGITALTILAFLGAGYTHEEGQYADQIDRALRWLIRQQRSDGHLGGNATRYARMYSHAMATYAIAEAYGMQNDPTIDRRLREPLARAILYIVDSQSTNDGGWRYLKGQKSDMSMFGWQLMALKSAEIAGISVPVGSKRLMIKFLKDRSLGRNNGLAAYRVTDPPLPPTPSMTAEALFCKQMLGIQRSNSASVEAANYLLARLPKRSELNLYYWYYGTLAMYQYGGKSWRRWNESLRDVLVADQRTSGHAAGSWDPKGPWGPYGGRIYSTALSTLCLEVYYRFLPLYQMGGQYEEE